MNIVKVKNWASVKRGEVFRILEADPHNYEYRGNCKYGHASCQLCETANVYQFKLVHTTDPTKSLWVGSECVKKYYEIWKPNGLERAIERLKQGRRQLRKEQVLKKLETFRLENSFIVDYLLGSKSYRDAVLPDGTRLSKVRASLRRKGYLRGDEIKHLVGQLVLVSYKYTEFLEKYICKGIAA